MIRFRLRAMALALFLSAGAAGCALARPFTVDDLLRQEWLGAAAFDPSGRWLLFERRGPYDTAPRFDQDQDNALASGRLWTLDTRSGGPPRLFLKAGEQPGQVLGDFSPDGRRVAVYQLRDGRWRLGVATVATGQVRWLGLTPSASLYGRSFQWISETTFVVMARPDGVAPWPLRLGRLSADTLPRLWARAAAGAVAVTAVGSGAHLEARRRPPADRLLRVDVLTGRQALLGEGAYTDLEVSPDGRRVALRTAHEDLQPKAGQPVQGDWGLALQAERLEIRDLATGRAIAPLPQADLLPFVFAWSPSGRALLVFARGPGEPWTRGRLLVVDAASGAAEPAGPELAPAMSFRPEVVRADWLGETPVVLARQGSDPQARPDWWRLGGPGAVNLTAGLPVVGTLAVRQPDALVLVSAQGAWRVDRDGRAKRLSSLAMAPARRPRTGRDGRLFEVAGATGWAIAGDAARGRALVRLTAGATEAGPALPADASLAASIGLSGGVAVATVDARNVERLSVIGPAGIRSVAVLNKRLADVDPPRMRAVRHLGPDGQPLTSWLYLPAAAGGAPPLVVKVYAGAAYGAPPGVADGVLGFPADIRVLVGHGYAVLVPSLPGPRDVRDEPAQKIGERIVAVVDAATAVGGFDAGRVALWGHSFGGYTVMAALTQTSRFRAAVSVSGFPDLTAKWAGLPAPHRTLQPEGVRSNFATGSVEAGQGGMGGPPWTAGDRYDRNSPLLAADRIVTPLFLAHGDQDGGVALSQSEAMFSALYRQGKDAVLVTYWGEGHYISSPGNVRDLYARAFAFLDRHLAGGQSPAGR